MALSGIKVVEMLGLAPGPFCGTILSDFGALVTVVQKVGQMAYTDSLLNGKRSICVNLKMSEGFKIVSQLCNNSDVLIDTYRPGVMEKLGLGPEVLLKNNPKLIYARLTGYGQSGFYREKAGHDINFIALSGVLSLLSKNNEPPNPPTNFLGDFAGGSVICALGILLALFERTKSGKGQIIDASMTEGAAYIATWIYKNSNLLWNMEPGNNPLDGGFPAYNTYKTKDGKFMALGALEPQFYQNLLKGLNLPSESYDPLDTDKCKMKFSELFLTKTQAQWCQIFDNLDACVTPVLNINSVDTHQCNITRKSFYREDNLIMPEPAPKLSRTPGKLSNKLKPTEPGQHTTQILQELGYKGVEIKNLFRDGTISGNFKSNL